MRIVLTALFALAGLSSAVAETNDVAETVASTNDTATAVASTNAPVAKSTVGSIAGWRIATRVFKLNHANAKEVADKFNATWNGEFGQTWKVTKMAVPFEESNSLMVTAPGAILDACEKALRELDV